MPPHDTKNNKNHDTCNNLSNSNNSKVLPPTPDMAKLGFAKMKKRGSSFWPSERQLLKRHPSLELLVPAHDCATRQSSPSIAIFNLVATVCGGGVLSLPIAFSRAGLIPSFIMMVFAALITNFAMYILCSCARRTGGRSYGDVMRNAFGPRAEMGATCLLVVLLFFVLVAYMVLLQDIWTPVVFHSLPCLQTWFTSRVLAYNPHMTDPDEIDAEASHLMLVVLLVCTLPLLLQTDLHALRHTCYIGFASAVILMLGVIQQALQRNLWEEPGIFTSQVTWVGDVAGIMYAFPIIVLSFFSIYNVLTVHSALFNPTRERVKLVLDGTIGLCFLLFFTVGVAGYLFAYDDTRDNILLNFPLNVTIILVGRIGYGVTIMFGMPLVFLPCRAAILSLPDQVREWNEAVQQASGDAELALQSVMKGAKHHVANGVTFDEECPLVLEHKVVREKSNKNNNNSANGSAQKPMGSSSGLDLKAALAVAGMSDYGSVISENTTTTDDSYSTLAGAILVSSEPVPVVDPQIEDEGQRDRRVHILSTIGILVGCYIMAVGVPGVGVVWRIAGSSMAIIIGFIIPTSCYLKIRSKKSINPRSVGALLLLIFSTISSVVCTINTIRNLNN